METIRRSPIYSNRMSPVVQSRPTIAKGKTMVPFRKHVFVCTGGKVCPTEGGSLQVHARLKELVGQAGLESSVRINHAGCLGQCGYGPMVVIYPENVWYCGVGLKDVEEIFVEHLQGGRPVERLIYHPQHPGINKKSSPV
jgi:(2Fe-2S) ferredoxin